MDQPASTRKTQLIAYWLLIGVLMIIIQILLGGITRLTGSGLSITEWKPIMGTLPPLNAEDWQEAFEKYQQIAQYKYTNAHFTVGDFKWIFFWEWFHRLWARLLGVVFAIPFIYFLIRGYFRKDMIMPLIVLFLLGALQGLIGWVMVQSGIGDSELLRVSHFRLAIHFMAALVLLCYTLWFALKLLVPTGKILYDTPTWKFSLWCVLILSIQLIYGAFMAGLQTATVAPTWPTINGDWIPSGMIAKSWLNHPINIHFVHRGLAYLIFILIFFGFFKLYRLAKANNNELLKSVAKWPLILVSVQVLLGILTVLFSVKIVPGHFGIYETFAQLHQLVAMALLMVLFVVLFLVRKYPRGNNPAGSAL